MMPFSGPSSVPPHLTRSQAILEHVPLAGYFLAILTLALTLALAPTATPAHPHTAPASLKRRRALYTFLTVFSLLTTWAFMFAFFRYSYVASALRAGLPSGKIALASWSTAQWLNTTGLFREAWVYVCMTTERWWWSEQICLVTTGVWTVFLFTEASRRRIPHPWAYMILGQIVAISFSSALFFYAILSRSTAISTSPSAPRSRSASPSSLLLLSLVIANLTVPLTPWSTTGSGRYFLPNLILMHLALVLPLIRLPSPSSSPKPLLTTRQLYFVLSLFSTLYHLRTLSLVLAHSSLWKVLNELHAHPAQASIGWDAICTGILWEVWMLYGAPERRTGRRTRWALAVVMPVVGVAGCAGWWAALEESGNQEEEEEKKE